MTGKQYRLAAAIAFGLLSSAAAAQFGSQSEQFLTAVRERDGAKAQELLRSGGPTIINARDGKGQTALIIAIARRDEDWSYFLLSQRADVNAPARDGDTPLITAARVGSTGIANELLVLKAKVDAANRMGETALIVAVQQRNLPMVKLLLGAGADADKTDNAAGYSARDYAKRDARAREILRVIESRKPKA